jgi:tellurite resistance protein
MTNDRDDHVSVYESRPDRAGKYPSCGTRTGVLMHKGAGEPLCDACAAATDDDSAAARERRRRLARWRAAQRLKEIYPSVYDALFEEELTKLEQDARPMR